MMDELLNGLGGIISIGRNAVLEKQQKEKERTRILELDSFEISMKKDLKDYRDIFGDSFF